MPATYNHSRTLGGLPLFERRPITGAGRLGGLSLLVRANARRDVEANVKPLVSGLLVHALAHGYS